MSLKQQILNYLQDRQKWISGTELEDFARTIKYKSSNCSRRCRELYNEGLIDRKYEKGFVSYRYTKETIEVPVIGTIKNEKVYFSPEYKLEDNQLTP